MNMRQRMMQDLKRARYAEGTRQEYVRLIDRIVEFVTERFSIADQIEGESWEDFNKEGVTLANMRGNWTVGWIEENMPNIELELVDTIADTVRLVGQGRADAFVENIDFFMAFTENYPDVNWRVVETPAVSSETTSGRDVLPRRQV